LVKFLAKIEVFETARVPDEVLSGPAPGAKIPKFL
jgi:hypothetical protein